MANPFRSGRFSGMLGPALATAVAMATAAPLLAEDVIAFRDVRVFDGTGVIPAAMVVVRGGRIEQVGPMAPAPDGARVVDGRGKTLLPGLIDAHVHAFSVEHLKQAAVLGVTTELDMFTDPKFAARMRSEQAAGTALDRADLRSAGTLVTAPGGHGTEYGLKIPTIAAAGQARDFVDARIAEGSDYIKIAYDGGEAFDRPIPTISAEALAAAIRAAHDRKRLAVVHALTRERAREALEDGADGLVHVFIDRPADDALIRLAVERRAFVIPTLTGLEGIAGSGGGTSVADDPDLAPWLGPDAVASLGRTFPMRRPAETRGLPIESVRRLKAAGVPILAGTDAINPGTAHGASLHRELELLVEAGLSTVEALAAATSAPARAFGLSDRGRIAPGARADLVLIDGDPTADIRATRKIAGVWKAGRAIDRDAYRKALQQRHDALVRSRSAPAPNVAADGLVSDFDGDRVRAAFGSGWSLTTDLTAGGESTASYRIVPGGAHGSKGALQITGVIQDRPQPRWAGALYSPGPRTMTPTNLSSRKAVSFQARGDGRTYMVTIYSISHGFSHAEQTFVAGKDWRKYRFELKDFAGCEPRAFMGLLIGGGPEAGPFALFIDDVRLE